MAQPTADFAGLPPDVQRIVTSEAQLREAQAMAGVGSWQWNIASNEISWSEELYRHFGLNPETFEATFEAFLEHIHPEDAEMVNATVQKAFADHAPWSFEHRIVRPNGEVRWVFGQGAVEMQDGKPVRMFGTEQDITERKEAQAVRERALEQDVRIQQLEQSNEFRIQMLNTVAHELNTPLTPLALQAHLLRTSYDKPTAKQEKAMDILERNVRRLKLLISDILDVARMQADRLELRPAQMNVADVVEDAVETFEEAASQAGVSVTYDGDQDLQIIADQDRLTQVVYNLLGNAIKFAPKGTVRITTRRAANDVVLEVQDDGMGITPFEAEQLFQPFSQVHHEQNQPGTGLGLFISRGIVEAHEGTLEMESGGTGHGTTFRMRIPIK